MPARVDELRQSPPIAFGEWVLRGVGQVFLQNNPLTGALFLCGIFLSSWAAGLYAVLGTVVATGTAMLLGVPRRSLAQGLFGFNGTLTAIDLSFYLRHDWQLLGFVIVAAATSSVLAAALQNFLGTDHIPMLTAAFVTTTWLFLAGLRQFGNLSGERTAVVRAHLPHEAGHGGSLQAHDLVTGFFNGFSQVLLQSGVWAGAVILLGIAVNSRISALAAAAGSLIGIGSAWALGFPADQIAQGLSGYNSVLTLIALAGLYYLLRVRSVLYAVFAGIVTVVAAGALDTLLAPVGLPLLTAPFVVTTWIFLFAAGSLTALHAIHPDDAGTPEHNLAAADHLRENRWHSGASEGLGDPRPGSTR